MRLPMYAKLLPFQELLLAAFFSAAKQFAFFVISMCLPISRRNGEKNPTKRRKKSRAQNVQTETQKKLETTKI